MYIVVPTVGVGGPLGFYDVWGGGGRGGRGGGGWYVGIIEYILYIGKVENCAGDGGKLELDLGGGWAMPSGGGAFVTAERS